MAIFRLPPRARLIYIPGDDGRTREFVLRRRLLAAVLAGAGVLALLVVTFLSSYAVLIVRSTQVSRLQRELRTASDQLEHVRDLNRELDQMRRLQEQVQAMLGVTAPARPGEPGAAPPAGSPDAATPPARLPGAAGAVGGQGGGLITAPPPDAWPVKGYVTREFAAKAAKGDQTGHGGMDIVAPLETELRAAGKGIVAAAGWDNFLGNYVEITHGLGYETVYGHCSRLAVREGDRVDRGQVIGYLGGTGQASAPHLHFEVLKDGVAIDPRLLMAGDPPR